jgi:MoaA/NifB/PqqE/SkfB family radical SAM enzyme
VRHAGTRAAGAALDAARWSSILALDGDYAAGRTRLQTGPLEAYIEVAARCNLRCQMCPITVDPRYDPHSGNPPLLTRQLFERLAPLIPTLQRAYLMGLGEPFLNRDLIDYAERLAGAGVEVWITTNATLVRDEHAEALARIGVARMTVSIDGATAATYERIRRRGKFEDLLRGLRALGAARRRHGRPLLFLNMVAMAGNLHELPAMIDLCAEVGGDGVHLEGLYEWPGLEEVSRRENLSLLAAERIEELLAEARRRAAGSGVQLFSRLDELALFSASVAGAPAREAVPLPEAAAVPARGLAAPPAPDLAAPLAPGLELVLPWACSEPWATINVSAAGDVRPCCFNDQPMGNLSERSWGAIWNGPDYRQLRADHAAGRVPGSCAQCVRNGRVKRSAFLAPRPPRGAVPFRPARRARLLAPADGELIGGPLVVVGELPPRFVPRLLGSRADLPELRMDGSTFVDLRHYALVDGNRFAAVIPIPCVTAGAHVLVLGLPTSPGGAAAATAATAATAGIAAHEAAGGKDAWDQRRLQIGRLGGETADLAWYAHYEIPPAPATLTAVARLAVALSLRCHELVPELRLGGTRHPIAAWLCGPHAEGRWLGVALVDVDTLAPGAYPLELRLRQHPVFRRRLVRLSPPHVAHGSATTGDGADAGGRGRARAGPG